MDTKKSAVISLILNSLIFILVSYAVINVILVNGLSDKSSSVNIFCYFTVESNIFSAIAAAVFIPRCIKKIIGKPVAKSSVPIVLKLAAAGATAIVFLVVAILLGPMYGYMEMFTGANFYLHALCPILTFVSFCFFDGDGELERGKLPPTCLPVFLYSLVYLTMLMILKKWPDFYGFNRGGLWYVSFLGMNAANPLVVNVIRRIHNRVALPVSTEK